MSHKIIFEELFAKNFRSIDNMGLRIQYNSNGTTLISSLDNGQGKSTLSIWALYFVLFDKPYGKDAKKPSLVNTRNNKDCLVEVNFKTKGSQWLVRRGIKPTVFEIYKDGVLVDPTAKDYQDYLEDKVLGFDEKTFANTVILHKDRFVPFVNMSTPERRSYVEKMMDLNVFTSMSDITKEKIKTLKRELDIIEYECSSINTKIEAKQSIIKNLEESLSKKNGQLDGEISKYESENIKCNDLLEKFKEKESAIKVVLSNFNYNKETHDRVKKIFSQMQDKIATISDRISNVKGMDACPTCKQHVSGAMKDLITKSDQESLEELKEGLCSIINKDQDMDLVFNDYRAKNEELTTIQDTISKINNMVSSNNSFIKSYLAMKTDNGESEKIISQTKEKDVLYTSLNVLRESEKVSLKELDYYNELLNMLKDNGVKADIIKQYVPHLNTKINEYLEGLSFNINLAMDEEFNIQILSPGRKNQAIGSLSSGQQARINLAVLFAWREISTAKSSMDCNILVLDEILESLSESGVVDFTEMFRAKFVNTTNLFVITQRSKEFETYFDNTILFGMKDDFTVMIEDN